LKRMKIKKGDTVIVKTGKDNGKTGTVLRVDTMTDRVVVEGLNMVKRATRSRVSKDKSQIIEKPASLHISNVMLFDAKAKKGTRVGYKMVDGKNVRIAKASGTQIK